MVDWRRVWVSVPISSDEDEEWEGAGEGLLRPLLDLEGEARFGVRLESDFEEGAAVSFAWRCVVFVGAYKSSSISASSAPLLS